jgi:uncharacterized protein (UPF0333 family)
MRGQTAVEYLLVFSALLGAFAIVTMAQMITPATDAARDALYLSQARSAADAIAGTIDAVYTNGPGAVKSVSFQMDASWDLELDNAGNKLRITVDTSEGTKRAEENLRYEIDNHHSLPNVSIGLYTVIVEWSDNASVLEGIDSSEIADGKLFIYIRPRGR